MIRYSHDTIADIARLWYSSKSVHLSVDSKDRTHDEQLRLEREESRERNAIEGKLGEANVATAWGCEDKAAGNERNADPPCLFGDEQRS